MIYEINAMRKIIDGICTNYFNSKNATENILNLNVRLNVVCSDNRAANIKGLGCPTLCLSLSLVTVGKVLSISPKGDHS